MSKIEQLLSLMDSPSNKWSIVKKRLKKYETEGLDEFNFSALLGTVCPHWEFEDRHTAAKMILKNFRIIPKINKN